MDGPAVILCPGRFRTSYGKSAHGLVRGTDRYRIVGVVDADCAGQDAGEVLDGVFRGIPVFASLAETLDRSAERPRWAIIGVATAGGVLPPDVRAAAREAADRGLSIVSGLHEYLSDDRELVELARARGVSLVDVRKPRPQAELRFWTGEILGLRTPRVAVLGTDCAIGKRTTARLVLEACRRAGLRTELVHTGQTGWMQGSRFGVRLDSLPNDFVSGELERAVVECVREIGPELVLIPGQSGLRNPSGPCGSEIIVSARARGVILQHAPGRRCFHGTEVPIPPVAEEVQLIRLLGSRVLALALNNEGLALAELEAERRRLSQELGIPVVLPLEEGVESIVPVLRAFAADPEGP